MKATPELGDCLWEGGRFWAHKNASSANHGSILRRVTLNCWGPMTTGSSALGYGGSWGSCQIFFNETSLVAGLEAPLMVVNYFAGDRPRACLGETDDACWSLASVPEVWISILDWVQGLITVCDTLRWWMSILVSWTWSCIIHQIVVWSCHSMSMSYLEGSFDQR